MPKKGEFVLDGAYKGRCRVVPTGRAAVDGMIRQRHYLNRWPGVVTAVYCLLRDDSPVGACVYALPPRETFKRYGGLGWELARLWIDDSMPKNSETWFVAQTIKDIRLTRSDVKFLVSYADPSAGHEGIIYRAGNWLQDGRTDEERNTPRFDYVGASVENLFGESHAKKYSRKSHVPEDVAIDKVARVSKFRFVYQLHREKSCRKK